MQPSPTAITLRNRYTWVALLLIAVSVIMIFSSFGSGGGMLLKLVTLVAAALSALIWFVMYRNSREYFDGRVEAEQQARRNDAKRLQDELLTLGHGQASDHVAQLTNKLDDYNKVLKMRFGENEVTYQRYFGVGQQLYDGANNNLQGVLASARSIKSIDTEHLEGQLYELERRGRSDSREAEAIKDRYRIYVDQKKQIDRLIEQNEEALTALSNATTQLASVDTNASASSASNMDSMIDDLKRLAERVDQYGVRL